MNLELRPGRICYIIPGCTSCFAGKFCTLRFYAGRSLVQIGNLLTSVSDCWVIAPQGIGEFSDTGQQWGCRAAWLIPIPDNEEGEKLFSTKQFPVPLQKEPA